MSKRYRYGVSNFRGQFRFSGYDVYAIDPADKRDTPWPYRTATRVIPLTAEGNPTTLDGADGAVAGVRVIAQWTNHLAEFLCPGDAYQQRVSTTRMDAIARDIVPGATLRKSRENSDSLVREYYA